MGTQNRPYSETTEQVDMNSLLYTASPSGPASAFKPLSNRKIDAGVTTVINARFNRHKPDGPA